MIYFALALVLPSLWFGNWLLLAPVAMLAGFLARGKGSIPFALASGVAWAALAYLRAGPYGGVIFRRTSAMFSLPAPWGVFVVIVLVGFITTWLWFHCGGIVASQWPVSRNPRASK